MINVIILAGGKEENLYPISKFYNVPSLPVFNEDLVSIWIRKLKDFESIGEIDIVSTENIKLNDRLEKYKRIYDLVKLDIVSKDLGSAYTLAYTLLNRVFSDLVMVVYGNTFIKKIPNLDDLDIREDKIYLFFDYQEKVLEQEDLLLEDEKRLTISKGSESGYVFAGILLGSRKKILRYLKKTPTSKKFKRFTLFDTINLILKSNEYEIIEVDKAIRVNNPRKYFYMLENYGKVYLEEKISDYAFIEGKLRGSIYVGDKSTISYGVFVKGPVYIGNNVYIEEGVKIKPYTILLDNTKIGSNSVVSRSLTLENVNIEDLSKVSNSIIGINTYIGSLVTISSLYDELEDRYNIIGNNSRILDNSVIINGIRVHDNSIIYYNSVCDRDIPEGHIYREGEIKRVGEVSI